MPVVYELAIVTNGTDVEAVTNLLRDEWEPFGLTSKGLALRRSKYLNVGADNIEHFKSKNILYWTVMETINAPDDAPPEPRIDQDP